MKKRRSCVAVNIAAIVLVAMLLASCGLVGGRAGETGAGGTARGVTAEDLEGVWRQEDYQRRLDRLETVYEIYFADDGMIFILATFDTTGTTDLSGPYHTEIQEVRYRVEDGALVWEMGDAVGGRLGTITDIRAEPGRVVLHVGKYENAREIVLAKTSDAIPDSFTAQGREQEAAQQQSLREGILAFAAQLSETYGMDIELNETDDFALEVPESVHFTSAGVNLHITSASYAEEASWGGYCIPIPDGAMNFYAECYVLGEYAIVFDAFGAEIPPQWETILEDLAG